MSICKHYRAIFDTPSIQEDKAKKLMTMKRVCQYIVLSSYDNEQSDLIHRILKEKVVMKDQRRYFACLILILLFQVLEELPVYKTLLEQFTNIELIDKATLDKQYEKELREGTGPDNPPTGVFDPNTEMGRKHWQDLRYGRINANFQN